MADDNSRGRRLKSSFKNERDRCVPYVREATTIDTNDGGGGCAEYNDCRQIAAPRSTCTRTTAGTAKP